MQSDEINKGRREIRQKVFNLPGAICVLWCGAKQAVCVEHQTTRKGKLSIAQAYFLSSLELPAKVYGAGIRSHWAIENSLHWVKDVVLREDALRMRTGHAPAALSMIKNMALNIFRKHGMNEIQRSIRLVSNDIKKIYSLII